MGQPLTARSHIFVVPVGADGLAHRDAAHPLRTGPAIGATLIGWTAVNFRGPSIGAQLRVLRIEQELDVGVVGCAAVVQPAAHPTSGLVIFIRRKPGVIVVGIHLPRQHHLVQIVHAVSGLRAKPGLGQHGQKQGRQDGDDRNDHQQLD